MSEAKALAQDKKYERRLEKKASKKQDKKERKQQLRLAHRIERYTLLKTTAIIFFFLALFFLVQFILAKFCNYYFNFGDDAKNYDVNWMNPFDKWNWELRNQFDYVEANVQSTVPGTTVSGKVLIIVGLYWDGTNQAIAVTREALVINNFANLLLYVFFTTTFVVGVILLLCYFLIGRRKIREVIEEYADYKVALGRSSNNTNNGQPVLFKETIILRDSERTVHEEKPSPKPVKPEPEPIVIEDEDDTEPVMATPKGVKKKRKKYPSVGKKDLVAEMYEALKGSLTLRELNRIYDLTFETIVEELMKSQENEIMIPNFGKFVKVTIPAHEGINPSTGNKVWIPTKHKVKFSPSITLKRLMENTTKKK